MYMSLGKMDLFFWGNWLTKLCSLSLQLLGCRGSLAEREAGQIFATPARICQVPVHPDE